MYQRLTVGRDNGDAEREAAGRRQARWRILPLFLLLLLVAAVAGCSRPLPEENTAAAQLYAKRCGQCHRAYGPGLLSAAMWEVQVQMMESKMRQYRVPPLTDKERETILSYLTRNSER